MPDRSLDHQPPLDAGSRRFELSRRQTLKWMAYATASISAGGFVNASTMPQPVQRRQDNTSVVREIKRILREVFEGREMGLYFSHLNENHQEDFVVLFNEDRLYPVASAFKAAVVLFYLFNTPRDEWQYELGSDLYSTAVYSNNRKTGYVIAEVAKRLGKDNPIVAFNDFVTDPSLLGLQFGLYQWTFAEYYMPTNGFMDERFAPGKFPSFDVAFTGVNYSSPNDLAKLFRFMALAEEDPRWETDELFRDVILASRDLLSITIDEYTSPLERVITYTDHYSKDGTLRPVDIGTFVQNDAGVWLMHDGGAYLISFMSATEGNPTVEAALAQIAESMRLYQGFLHPNDFRVLTEPSVPLKPDSLNYGFVRKTGIKIYTEPREGAPEVDNHIRATSIFGTTYLMYKALVRIRAVDDVWAEVIADDKWDEAFEWPIFVKLEDLQIIDWHVAEAIGYITGQPENTGKWGILDIYNRELIFFEGVTPILRTPVILNTQATPRGVAIMNRAYMTRDMPNYPGVPYSTFLHGSQYLDEGGFAVHGAPWQLWEATVRQSTVLRRRTHGCINLPDWEIPISFYGKSMRTDEFIFRWAGGFPNPANDLVYLNSSFDAVRVIALNNMYREIYEVNVLPTVRENGMGWKDIMHILEDKTVDAPDYYFS